MKVAALAVSGLLSVAPADRPPVEYQGPDPITVQVTFASQEWVNAECTKRVGRQPAPGMIFWACAGIGQKWAILPNGCLFDDGYAGLTCHEISHVRGWRHDAP